MLLGKTSLCLACFAMTACGQWFNMGGRGGGGDPNSVKETRFYELLDTKPENFAPGKYDEKALKRKHRELLMKYHPDKNRELSREEASKKITEINKAYETLSNEKTRKIYNMHGEKGLENSGAAGSSMDIDDILSSVFGSGFGGGFGGFGGQARRRRGPDMQVRLDLPLAEIYKGYSDKITLQRQRKCSKCEGRGAEKESDVTECSTCKGKGQRIMQQMIAPGMYQQFQMPCGDCDGKGKVFKHKCASCDGVGYTAKEEDEIELVVPRGAPEQHAITYAGRSHEGPDFETGDLHVIVFSNSDAKVLSEQSHPAFVRSGNDLLLEQTITLVEALEGFSRTLKHMDEHEFKIVRKGTTQPEHVEVIAGEGMPIMGTSRFGELRVKIHVELPENLTAQQLEAIKCASKKSCQQRRDEL